MYLVTSGCSFSEVTLENPNWSGILSYEIKSFEDVKHTAKSMQDNGMIMRKAMYHVNKLKQQNQNNNILLLVMWSGFSRHSYLSTPSDYLSKKKVFEDEIIGDVNHWMLHNQGIDLDSIKVREPEHPSWIFWSPRFLKKCKKLEEHAWKFSNSFSEWEQTAQYMISLQNYCIANNVKYFWATFDNKWEKFYKTVIEKQNIKTLKWMWDLINHNNRFLSIGMHEWTLELDKQNIFPAVFQGDGWHPNRAANEYMVEKVLLPFLKNKRVLYS